MFIFVIFTVPYIFTELAKYLIDLEISCNVHPNIRLLKKYIF